MTTTTPAPRTRVRRAAVVAWVGALALLLCAPVAAQAHSQLVSSDPAAGSEVTALDQITLTFNEDLTVLDPATAIEVTGPAGTVELSEAWTIDGATLTQPIALPDAGTYQVTWRVVSADGHPIDGTFDFSYAPAATVTDDDGSPTPDASGTESAVAITETLTPEASESAVPVSEVSEESIVPISAEPISAEPGDSDNTGLWLGFAAVAIVAAGVALVVRSRRSRP